MESFEKISLIINKQSLNFKSFNAEATLTVDSVHKFLGIQLWKSIDIKGKPELARAQESYRR